MQAGSTPNSHNRNILKSNSYPTFKYFIVYAGWKNTVFWVVSTTVSMPDVFCDFIPEEISYEFIMWVAMKQKQKQPTL
jgi:hypothetical protein